MLEDVSKAETVQIRNQKCIRHVPKLGFPNPSPSLSRRQKMCGTPKAKNQIRDGHMPSVKFRVPRTNLHPDPFNAEMPCSFRNSSFSSLPRSLLEHEPQGCCHDAPQVRRFLAKKSNLWMNVGSTSSFLLEEPSVGLSGSTIETRRRSSSFPGASSNNDRPAPLMLAYT
jgi:hypothetical protein